MNPAGIPPIVSSPEWHAAVDAVNRAEEELQKQIEAVAAQRRRLPMTPVAEYAFTGPDGEVGWADLFGDARQLIVYHAMYAPDWDEACPHCTQYARNQGAGINDELAERDACFVLISRAPQEKLAAWAALKGITTPWYSAPRAFSEEMGVIDEASGDFPGISVFLRTDDGTVHRTYRTNGVAIEATMPASGLLRMAPWGLQERGEDSPEGWPQRFDPM